jgi:hypothetical protein
LNTNTYNIENLNNISLRNPKNEKEERLLEEAEELESTQKEEPLLKKRFESEMVALPGMLKIISLLESKNNKKEESLLKEGFEPTMAALIGTFKMLQGKLDVNTMATNFDTKDILHAFRQILTVQVTCLPQADSEYKINQIEEIKKNSIISVITTFLDDGIQIIGDALALLSDTNPKTNLSEEFKSLNQKEAQKNSTLKKEQNQINLQRN